MIADLHCSRDERFVQLVVAHANDWVSCKLKLNNIGVQGKHRKRVQIVQRLVQLYCWLRIYWLVSFAWRFKNYWWIGVLLANKLSLRHLTKRLNKQRAFSYNDNNLVKDYIETLLSLNLEQLKSIVEYKETFLDNSYWKNN